MAAYHDLSLGTVVVQPVPGIATRPILAEELLLALGKAVVGVDARPPAGDLWDLATLWLRAERVRHLVIMEADRLAAPLWAELAAAAATIGCRLWLVVGATEAPGEHLRRLGTPVRTVTSPGVAAELPAPKSVEEPLGVTSVLPSDDFFTFRATCRDILEAPLFDRVDIIYLEAYAATLDLYTDRSHPIDLRVVEHLSDLVARSQSPAEAVVRLRAAQAACFRRGLHVRLLPRADADAYRYPHPGLRLIDADQAARLRRVWNPQVACILVLAYLLVLPNDAMVKLAVGDVAPDGDRVHLGGCWATVAPSMQAPLRAQVFRRCSDAAGDESSLLSWSTARPTAELARQLAGARAVAAMDTIDPAVWFPWRRPLPEAMQIEITRVSPRPFFARWKPRP